jgi:hypothetical protein
LFLNPGANVGPVEVFLQDLSHPIKGHFLGHMLASGFPVSETLRILAALREKSSSPAGSNRPDPFSGSMERTGVRGIVQAAKAINAIHPPLGILENGWNRKKVR